MAIDCKFFVDIIHRTPLITTRISGFFTRSAWFGVLLQWYRIFVSIDHRIAKTYQCAWIISASACFGVFKGRLFRNQHHHTKTLRSYNTTLKQHVMPITPCVQRMVLQKSKVSRGKKRIHTLSAFINTVSSILPVAHTHTRRHARRCVMLMFTH